MDSNGRMLQSNSSLRHMFQLDAAEGIEEVLRFGSVEMTDTGVIVIDLDGVKAVNDGLGHTAGDEILVQVGVRLKSALRSVDTVARLGGDEFVALCENLAVEDAEEQLETIVKRIRGMFDGSFMTSLGPATLGASIGWALVRPEADVDLTMVGTADQAMLDDKCVVIVDDDPAMRLLATRIIGSRSDKLRVVAQAADGQAAIKLPRPAVHVLVSRSRT